LDVETHDILTKDGELASSTFLASVLFGGDGCAQWALQGSLSAVVSERTKRTEAKIGLDLCDFNVQALVEIELESVGALGLESLEVLLVLSNYVRLRSKYSSGLKVEDLTSEVRGCDEVLQFVIAGHRIFESQESVSIVHTAQGPVAAELSYACWILRACCHQLLSLKLNSHCCDIFHQPLGQLANVLHGLV